MENERRHRVLTDADIEAISACINGGHCASFSEEEVRDIKAIIKPMKDLADVMKETRSVVIKTVVGVVLSSLLLLMVLGLKVWANK